MRTLTLFNNVSAASPVTSAEVNFDFQDARFLIQATKSGTDGNPRIIVEESIRGTLWSPLENTETWEEYSEQDVDILSIKDNNVMGNYLRVRLEPNGCTTGTVYLEIGYKTKP